MNSEITERCPRCGGQNLIPKPVETPIEGGTELDGRPLSATSMAVLTWTWTCRTCALTSPSAEAARAELAAGNPAGAIDLALRAAWIADDHAPESAAECREITAWLLRRYGGSDAVLADLHRRNGDLAAAAAAARRCLAAGPDRRLTALALHQFQLINVGDTGRHSMVALFESLELEAH